MDHTYVEIANQPNSWTNTLDWVTMNWASLDIKFKTGGPVLFIGCGTSYFLAQTAARLFQHVTGHVSIATPASEVFLAYQSVVPMNVPIVAFAISRSGTTSEVLMAVEHLQKTLPDVKIIGVTCSPDSPLAKMADLSIPLGHATEESVVMTQSFTNMLLAIQCIGALEARMEGLVNELYRLPDMLRQSFDEMVAFASQVGASDTLNQYIYLGLGAYYGLATEATLKLKEMTQTPCESYNPLEFRHGPISIVRKGTAVVYVADKANATFLSDVIADVAAVEGTTIAIGPASIGSMLKADSFLPIDELSDWSRSVLYMPPLQLIARDRAIHLGLNPDAPRNLTNVVVLKNN